MTAELLPLPELPVSLYSACFPGEDETRVCYFAKDMHEYATAYALANLSARPGVGADDAMVEVMARWFCIRDGFDPDATHTAYVGGIDESWPEWCNHVEEARDALAAALARKGNGE